MKRATGLALLACGLLAAGSLPAATPRLEAFRRLLVLEQGRVKPLDTYARNLLRQISGGSSPAGLDAVAWMARVLFTPRETLDMKVFRVERSDVLPAIGIDNRGQGLYSFSDLRPGLNRLHGLAYRYAAAGAGRPGGFENEVMRLFRNISVYYGLLDAFAFSRPDGPMTGAAPREPAILPPGAGREEPWLVPAQAWARNAALPAAMQDEIALLADAARAYAAGDSLGFDRSLEKFNRSLRERLGPAAGRPWKVSLEIGYNRVAPFFKAGLAYGLALLLLLAAQFFQRRLLLKLSGLALLAGWLLHGVGILARMAIMGRPPVTSLYETFIFVSWAAAAMGLVMAWMRRQELGILAGAVAALALLVIAGGYGLDGDTMGMLAAVLDSNLWLAVHVVTIALGYAGCVFAGIIGHVAIIQALKRRPAAMARTADALPGILAFGLAFTAIGTLMGGIWADLSWGRFWGWDPKENGALLLIAWCAVLFHARLAGWIGRVGFAAGSVGALVVVALAWFGVNLLGLGLHAYGFTSGASRGLLAFILLELVFLAVAVPLARKGSRS
ncbi:MAG: cytochrome c biogenesis protein CcsA [Acidobacteria bacterium]|nr:cytochrome c biogenesis protein CcsA [Acidobacteriota bacterium]